MTSVLLPWCPATLATLLKCINILKISSSNNCSIMQGCLNVHVFLRTIREVFNVLLRLTCVENRKIKKSWITDFISKFPSLNSVLLLSWHHHALWINMLYRHRLCIDLSLFLCDCFCVCVSILFFSHLAARKHFLKGTIIKWYIVILFVILWKRPSKLITPASPS